MAQTQQKEIVCFEYRDTLKTSARTEYIFIKLNDGKIERLEPLWRKRSRTGAHGEDCYTKKYLEKADAIVAVQVSNSGRHYCSLVTKKQLTQEELLKLAVWLAEYEHICEGIARDLIRHGLPEEVLADLLQRDP